MEGEGRRGREREREGGRGRKREGEGGRGRREKEMRDKEGEVWGKKGER